MNYSIAPLLMSLTFLAVPQAGNKDLDKFQGTWTLVSAAGQPLPAGTHAGLVFTGDKYQGLTNGKVDETGAVKIDASTKPSSIDLVIATGTSAGKTQLGIVDVTGETMTLTLAEPGSATRPAAGPSPNTLVLTKMKPLAKELEGSWEGALDVNGQLLHLIVKLARGTDGLPAGTLVSVDQGNAEAPIAAVVQAGSRITMIMPALRATFDGELKDGQITGRFRQGPGDLPLVLKKV